MNTTTYETIDEIARAINKKHGEGALIQGDTISMEMDRVTSGVLAYDLMLGGGWPVNQWSEIIGSESSGKTAVAYKTIAANQAEDPDWVAMWVSAEDYVPEYAAAIGVDLNRLWVVETNIMERAYDTVLRAWANRAVDMVVIDSLPALVPGDEYEKDMEAFTVGLGARLTGKFFRKSNNAQKRSATEYDRPCTGLMINQWRDKIGVMWGDPRTTPGGKAKNYHFFTRVEVKKDEWIKDGKQAVGQTIKARTLKNKTFKPQQQAVVDFYFTDSQAFHMGDFDTIKDMLNIAVAHEVITRSGAFYSFGDNKWRGRDAMVSAFREDLDLQEGLKKLITDGWVSEDAK